MSNSDHYKRIYEHYDECFSKHGDSAKGVDWPNELDAKKRYEVMLGLIDVTAPSASILDIGCGAGHFLDHLNNNPQKPKLIYTGLDISEKFIHHCKTKHPQSQWILADLLIQKLDSTYDYVIMNGVFTEKVTLSFNEMLVFWKDLLSEAFKYANKGLVFNVMSTQVDWERDDLFHLPLDVMANFVSKDLSRHFSIRKDYGLYEYAVYIYRQSN